MLKPRLLRDRQVRDDEVIDILRLRIESAMTTNYANPQRRQKQANPEVMTQGLVGLLCDGKT